MQHSTGKPTRYQAERIDQMRKLGCVACAVAVVSHMLADPKTVLTQGALHG
jgi:hypothetical protein